METIYGANRRHTLKKLYNSNNLYQATIIWSDCNIWAKVQWIQLQDLSLGLYGLLDQNNPLLLSPSLALTVQHCTDSTWRKSLTCLLEKFGFSSTSRNWNLSFFVVLLFILRYKLINYVMLLYNDTWAFLLRVPLFTNVCLNTSNI